MISGIRVILEKLLEFLESVFSQVFNVDVENLIWMNIVHYFFRCFDNMERISWLRTSYTSPFLRLAALLSICPHSLVAFLIELSCDHGIILLIIFFKVVIK